MGETPVTVARFHEVPARGCWIAKVYDPTLKRERSKTFGHGLKKRAAADLAPAVIAALQAQVAAAADNRGTVKEYADKWLARQRQHLSPTTLAGGYEVIVARIIRKFGRRPIAELSRSECRDWYDELRRQTKPERLSETTIERHHQVLRAILFAAVDDEVISRNPVAKMKRPRREEVELQVPLSSDVRNLSTLTGDFGRFVRLLVATGLRRGELMGLAWADIEPAPPINGEPTAVLNIRRAVLEAHGEITIGPTKSKRGRKVRVGSDAIAVIEEQRASVLAQTKRATVHPSAPVFPDVGKDAKGMKPHRPGWASEWWRRARDGVGMPGVRLHSLRHYHATSLLDQGVPINTVQKRLGHSKASTTIDIYGHGTDEGEEMAVKASRMPELPAP
jgi:integrase